MSNICLRQETNKKTRLSFLNSVSEVRMKVSNILASLQFIYFLNCSEAKSNNSVAKAIEKVLKEFFAKNSRRVDFVHCGSEVVVKKLIENVLHFDDDPIAVQISGAELSPMHELEASSILFFDSLENFEQMHRNIVWRRHPDIRNKHLVYIQTATKSDITEIIHFGFTFEFVNFLIEIDFSIVLIPSSMLSPTRCRINQLSMKNQYQNEVPFSVRPSHFDPGKYFK